MLPGTAAILITKQTLELQLLVNTTITVIFQIGSDPYSSLSPSEQQVRPALQTVE